MEYRAKIRWLHVDCLIPIIIDQSFVSDSSTLALLIFFYDGLPINYYFLVSCLELRLDVSEYRVCLRL